jgi:DNA uptake protein ComE-like DNA-binding protein
MECRKDFIIIVILIILFAITTSIMIYKPDIHNVNVNEIHQMYNIGDKLSCKIVKYVKENPDCTVDDLEIIDDIGPAILESIKKEYR